MTTRKKAFTCTEPVGEIELADERRWIQPLFPGEARGEIVSGNLTLICASLGTSYEIETKGKILLIEEWNIEPWEIDHLINHLYNAGKLQETRGIVFGECVNCLPDSKTGFENSLTLTDILEHFMNLVKVPAIYGLPLGHTRDMATIPLGCQVYLNETTGELFIEESGTIG
ncbi:hypothetical protein [Bacillus badius]|uniref:hypothetical protein n=1 Tax=Bacillus badius TaxID=1455 RepID=UPI0009E2098A